MALIDIEYGSLASSETMNKNFTYLDEKIAESNESIMTSISSILSNIATINSRLNDISENIEDSVDHLNTTLNDYKSKTKQLVKEASMVPNWSQQVALSLTTTSSYTASSNGYILFLPVNNSVGNLMVNNKAVVFKSKVNSYDHSAQLVVVPIAKGDIISCTAEMQNVYFVPSKNVSVENF